MPQKDTALLLAQTARSFINAYNAGKESGCFLIPSFPLFAFTEKLPTAGFRRCRIGAPERQGKRFVFPVELVCLSESSEKDFVISLQIVFAYAGESSFEMGGLDTGELSTLPCDYMNKDRFPLNPRVFRTGRVEFNAGFWEVWEEHWQKLST